MPDILESTGEEIAVVSRWLAGVLRGDGTLQGLPNVAGVTNLGTRVYDTEVPTNPIYPVILFSFQGGVDYLGVGSTRVLLSGQWQVVVIKKDADIGWSPAITKRIDALLHRKSGSVATGEVNSCVREAPVDLVETDTGITYRRRGGLYRIQAQSS